MRIEVGSAHQAADGETVCGDALAVVHRGDRSLLCVADGLGHGPQARAAADLACEFALAHPDHPTDALLRGMARALASSRGAAVGVLVVDEFGIARFAGVGNVELRAFTASSFSPVSVPGIIGRGAPRVLEFAHKLVAGDVLAMHTDGISTRVEQESVRALAMDRAAEALLRAGRKPHDDALCVFMRYLGASA